VPVDGENASVRKQAADMQAAAQQQQVDDEMQRTRVRAMKVVNEALVKRLRRFTDPSSN
jgi:hypothetical protein